jgi:SAM-dependent methyltransferase
MSETVVYIGKDLEAMSFAVNYHRWILEEFRPFLGKRIVEVGAGTGSFSKLLIESEPHSLSLVEPSKMYEYLTANIAQMKTDTTVKTYQSIFTGIADEIKQNQNPDSIIYVNVLEHIEDDEAELKAMYETLDDSGRVFIFVPAFQWLYGNFDKHVGHFRRYTKNELETKTKTAGFKILKSFYFDFAGVIPWWIKYRLLKSDGLESGAIKLYDKFVVPITKTFESFITPPFGKNLLLIAEKSL